MTSRKAYWTECDEPERGEQYAHNLPSEAIRQLAILAPPTLAAIFGTPPTRRHKSFRSSNARIASST
jgi:hypothetical protein